MSRFDRHVELLYLLELIVDNLELNDDKIHEAGDNLLVVKIKFLSIPTFIISQNDFESVKTIKSLNEMPNGKFVILSGISCLFNKRARDLVGEMQKMPLRIGIFCIDDTYPIAEATVPLTGCHCDQITMALNDHHHMPQPYIIHGPSKLFDPGKNPSGNINFKLKIACLGKHVTTYYQMKKNLFVMKSDQDVIQYSVKRLVPPISDEKDEQLQLDNEISKSDAESTRVQDELVDDDDSNSNKSLQKDKKKKKKKKKQ